ETRGRLGVVAVLEVLRLGQRELQARPAIQRIAKLPVGSGRRAALVLLVDREGERHFGGRQAERVVGRQAERPWVANLAVTVLFFIRRSSTLRDLANGVPGFAGLRVRHVLADAVDREHREDADDGDDDHELDERETLLILLTGAHGWFLVLGEFTPW